MSCAAEKAAFMRSLFYRPASPYSGGGPSHYSRPTALQNAYTEAAKPKMFIYGPKPGVGRNYSSGMFHRYSPTQSVQHGFSIVRSGGYSNNYTMQGNREENVPVINLDERDKPVFISHQPDEQSNLNNEYKGRHGLSNSHTNEKKSKISAEEFKEMFSEATSLNDIKKEQETLEQLLAQEKEVLSWNNN